MRIIFIHLKLEFALRNFQLQMTKNNHIYEKNMRLQNAIIKSTKNIPHNNFSLSSWIYLLWNLLEKNKIYGTGSIRYRQHKVPAE